MVVIIEGISGAGKSTQIEAVRRCLAPTSPEVVGEFSAGPIGRLIKAVYRDKRRRFLRLHSTERFADQTHLVLLADTIAKAEEIAASSADHLLVDRLFDSWLCYTLAANNRLVLSDGLVRQLYWHCRPEHVSSKIITIFLAVDVDTALERLSNRDGLRDRPEDRIRLELVARQFEELYTYVPVVRVQAEGKSSEVTASIIKAIGVRKSI